MCGCSARSNEEGVGMKYALVIILALAMTGCTSTQFSYFKTGVKGVYYAVKAKQIKDSIGKKAEGITEHETGEDDVDNQ